ncbi:MAG: BrnT family toxin [Nitrospiraceae bacterium]
MWFECDEAKRKTNIVTHDIDFEDVPEMITSLMLVGPDVRKDYGESRKIGFGFILGRLITGAFTEREPDSIRIFSARKANQREETYYQETIADELGKN